MSVTTGYYVAGSSWLHRRHPLTKLFAFALVLAGTAAYEREDYAAAVVHWERLLKRLPPDSEDARVLSESIGKARAAAGKKGGRAKPGK